MNTRDKILNSGLKLFLEYGFNGTSLNMIANEVGIGKSTLFHYFSSKEELFNAIFVMCKETYAQNQTVDDLLSEDSFHIIEDMYIFSVKHKNELMFMTNFENSPYLTDESREKGLSMNMVFYEYVVNGQKEGKIVNLPHVFLCMFMANAVIDSLDYVLEDGVINKERLKQIINFIINAIKL